MRVLVATAHPDDELMGTGPLILQLIAQGHHVDVLCFTENSVRHGLGAEHSLDGLRTSCGLLGASVQALGYPDQGLDQLPFLSLVRPLEEALAKASYDWVLTHSEHDLNRDHRLVSEATRVAARTVPVLAEYPALSSTEHEWGGRFEANWYVEVTADQVEQTYSIFENSYPEEVCAEPHPRSKAGMKALWSRAGGHVRSEFAVPLRLIRMKTATF